VLLHSARTHARMHARMHALMHARMHARMHTHTHTQLFYGPLGGGEIASKLPTPPSSVRLVFRKRVKDHNSNFKILNGNDFCILYRNLATFGLVTTDITR